jgi:hypothetical protein
VLNGCWCERRSSNRWRTSAILGVLTAPCASVDLRVSPTCSCRWGRLPAVVDDRVHSGGSRATFIYVSGPSMWHAVPPLAPTSCLLLQPTQQLLVRYF